jgi:hypothetical protein
MALVMIAKDDLDRVVTECGIRWLERGALKRILRDFLECPP